MGDWKKHPTKVETQKVFFYQITEPVQDYLKNQEIPFQSQSLTAKFQNNLKLKILLYCSETNMVIFFYVVLVYREFTQHVHILLHLNNLFPVLTLQTELLILAHECFTASCDMEGVSNILRAARILTAHLVAAAEYPLMVTNVLCTEHLSMCKTCYRETGVTLVINTRAPVTANSLLMVITIFVVRALKTQRPCSTGGLFSIILV